LSARDLKKTLYPALIISKAVVLPNLENTARDETRDEIEKLIKDLIGVF